MVDTAQVHSRQVEYWNGEGAARWLANHTRQVDRVRATFADAALERAAVRPGERVIEIGCGTGDASLQLAERVGPTGALLAVDVSAMLAAEAQARLAPFPQARAAVGDAAAYPFEPRAADLLFSQFGVMFFGDPRAAFAHMRTALKPTGRLLFVCWRAPEPNPVLDIVHRHLPRPPADGFVEPGPQAFSDKARVEAILTGAGFTEISFEGLDGERDISRGKGAAGAVEGTLEGGPIYRLLAKQPDTIKAAIAEHLHDYFGSVEQHGAVMQPASVWIVGAKP